MGGFSTYLFISGTTVTKLVPENELFLVLVRLRLGLLVEDSATRFCVTKSFVSRVFQKWLDVMYIRLSFLIAWPERDMCMQNMPKFILGCLKSISTIFPGSCCRVKLKNEQLVTIKTSTYFGGKNLIPTTKV